jgi:hypothetical protein
MIFRGLIGLLAVCLPLAAFAQAVPQREASCARTQIKSTGERLTDGVRPIAGSGSAVAFADGVALVSYGEVAAIQQSRAGDQVILCLIAIPRGCPAGDNRGRIYTATNLRLMTSWTLADSEHSCGGA